MILEFYKTFSISVATIIIVGLLLGVDITVKPFRYSLKNLLKKIYKLSDF